jgi:hypothetical protein
MHFALLAPTLVLALGATAVPLILPGTNSTSCKPDYTTELAFFENWTSSCEEHDGHFETGTFIVPAWEGLCFGLPDNTQALNIQRLVKGCTRMFSLYAG